MSLKITQVDAFTNRPFRGNPAAVCILDAPPTDVRWMRDVAREMNLSETAFLWPHEDDFDLRWFTPATEVELCGHATLASAHVLWTSGWLRSDQEARFHTLGGLLTANRHADWIELDFPARPESAVEAPPELAGALGTSELIHVGRSRSDLLVELASEEAVRALDPDFSKLMRIDVRGVIVTAPADAHDFDFVSRFFAPRVGVNEDPVTGSSHCCLGPYWKGRLRQNEFLAHQASERGGIVRVRVAGDRVVLGGQAVTVMTADLIS